jgi:sec-independent protein translocase protein TatB
MGGLGPGVGGFEILVIGLVALLVVGPKDLPVLMRRVGKMVSKARAMANEFRSSFDEMARQSELDDLRKEVEALRSGQGMYNLGADAEAAFKDIRDDLNKPADALSPPPPMPEFPDPGAQVATLAQAEPVMEPVSAQPAPVEPSPKPRRAKTADGELAPTVRKTRAKAKPLEPGETPVRKRSPRKTAP